MRKGGVQGDEYFGRGKELGYVSNTASAPQVGEDYSAGAIEMRRSLIVINGVLRYRYLERVGKDGCQEAATLRSRIEQEGDDFEKVGSQSQARTGQASYQE